MAEREVVIKYRVVADSSNATTYRGMAEGATAVQAAYERAGRAAVQNADDAAKAQSRRTIDILKQQEREAVAAERAAERAQKAQNARTVAILKQQEREAVAAERAAERVAKAQERAQVDAVRNVERERQRAETSRNRFSEGARKGLQGMVGLAEGVAYIGLSNEEDTAKLVQGVARIRGAAMVIVNTVEVISGFMRTMEALRAISGGAALAEGALAVARAKSTATTAAATAAEVGRVGPLAWLGRLVGLGGAGGAATGAGGAAAAAGAGLAGTAAAGAGVALSGLALYGMAANSYGMRDRVAGWMNGPPQKTVDEFGQRRKVYDIGEYGENYGWLESSGQSWLFTTEGMKQDQDRAKAATERTKRLEAATRERDQRLEEDRQLAAFASMRDQQLAEIGYGAQGRGIEATYRQRGLIPGRQPQLGTARTGVEESATALQRAQERYQELQRLVGRGVVGGQQVGEAGADIARAKEQELAAAGRQAKEEQQARLVRAQAAEQQTTARKEAEAARTRLADLEAKQARFRSTGLFEGVSGPDAAQAVQRNQEEIDRARQRAIEASNREAEASRNRLQVEQQISQEKLRAAEISIQKTQEEIGYRRQIIEQARSRLQTGQERFGAMDPYEQQRAIDLMRRARAEGTGRFRREELEFLRGMGGDAEETARGEYMRRGAAYRKEFGVTDEARIATEQKTLERLEVRLKDQRELRLNIERDDEGIAKQLAEEISVALADRDQALIRKVLDEYKKGEQQQARQREEAARNRAATVGAK